MILRWLGNNSIYVLMTGFVITMLLVGIATVTLPNGKATPTQIILILSPVVCGYIIFIISERLIGNDKELELVGFPKEIV